MDERSKRNIRIGILLIAVLIVLMLLRQCGGYPALERIALDQTGAATGDRSTGSTDTAALPKAAVQGQRAWEYAPPVDEGRPVAQAARSNQAESPDYPVNDGRAVATLADGFGEWAYVRASEGRGAPTTPEAASTPVAGVSPPPNADGNPLFVQAEKRRAAALLLMASPVAAAIGTILLDGDPPADSPG